jgi:hypothetical protein
MTHVLYTNKRRQKIQVLFFKQFSKCCHIGMNHYSLFFPGRRLRAPFTKSCNEMRPPYWLLYSTNQ